MPLAIDLFCGLLQAKFFSAANAAIEELMTRRAEKPDHVALSVGDDAPGTIPLELGLVGNLKDAIFSTGLASKRQIRATPPKSIDDRIPEWPARVINFLNVRLAAVKFSPLLPRGLPRALLGTIAAVGARRHNLEVLRAPEAFAAGCRHVELLFAPYTASPRLASCGAVELVGPLRRKALAAFSAKQIIHQVCVS